MDRASDGGERERRGRGARWIGTAVALLVAAPLSAETDRTGTEAQWRARTSVARDWLTGHGAERWARTVRYDGPPIVLRFSAHNPGTGSVVTQAIGPAFDVLRRMSNGKLTVQATWDGRVHSLAGGWAALAAGRTDMTACYPSLEPDRPGFRLLTLLDLPGLFPNAAVATAVSERLYRRYFRAGFTDSGVVMARLKATGPGLLFTRRPLIRGVDLSGVRVGVTQGPQEDLMRVLGAVPMVGESPAIVRNLTSGLIDGVVITDAAAQVYGVDKVAPEQFDADFGRTNLEYCLSPRFWTALPPDLKRVLNAWLRAEAQAEAQVFYGLGGAVAREAFRAQGGRVHQLDPAEERRWRGRLDDVEARAVERLARAGLPARRMMTDLRRWRAAYARLSENQLMTRAIEHPASDVTG